MNYETLKEEAKNITMDETKKEEMAQTLRQTKTTRKRSPLIRALPAAAVLAVAVGAGLLLWKGSLNPPAVTLPAPVTQATETADAQTAIPQETRGSQDGPALSENETSAQSGTEEPGTEAARPVSQGSANDETEQGTESFPPEGNAGFMYNLGPGETAPPMPTLIRSFEGYEPVKYYAEKGSYVLSPALSAAIEKYGSDPMVHYYLKITVIDPDAPSRTWDEWEALYNQEIERMWTPDVNGEFSILRSKVWETTTAVEFALYLRDPAFLENFPASPDYGYVIELFDEQSSVK
jgi:hypothetical protein